MTPREAAIVSAYTGYFLGDIGVLHAYAEEILRRPVLSHELTPTPGPWMSPDPETWHDLHEASHADFMALEVTDPETGITITGRP